MLSIDLALVSLLDVALLDLFASPVIYIFVIKPFVDERNVVINKYTLLAHYDSLTQLANRRLIVQNLKKLIEHCVICETIGALILIDLDDFKEINDLGGHDAGDAVLVHVAKKLTSVVRENDIVGRIGGDEFIVLIDHLGEHREQAAERLSVIAKKIQLAINQPLVFSTKTLQVGSSIGMALLDQEDTAVEILLKRADIAMYSAKKSTSKEIIYSTDLEKENLPVN